MPFDGFVFVAKAISEEVVPAFVWKMARLIQPVPSRHYFVF